MESELELRNLVRRYGQSTVVDDLNLAVRKGELVSLLGPSGCGKSTTLRMVAGFVQPSGGSILLREQDIAELPVHRRGVGLVFQSYALFPHLSVFGNVAFGLKRRGVKRPEVQRRVREMLEKVQLDPYADRMPAQLSGGQQQRVALARVLVLEPSVVLLDEPFSNLDAQLRQSMRSELRGIQQRLGFTAVFVTHDQEEAMALSDRIAVMDGGRLAQLDSPDEVYHRPATRFVAEFIGRANLFHGKLVGGDASSSVFEVGGQRWTAARSTPVGSAAGRDLMLRPDRVALRPDDGGDLPTTNAVRGEIVAMEYLGGACLVTVALTDGRQLTADVSTAGPEWRSLAVGRPVVAGWDAADIHVLPQSDAGLSASIAAEAA